MKCRNVPITKTHIDWGSPFSYPCQGKWPPPLPPSRSYTRVSRWQNLISSRTLAARESGKCSFKLCRLCDTKANIDKRRDGCWVPIANNKPAIPKARMWTRIRSSEPGVKGRWEAALSGVGSMGFANTRFFRLLEQCL